MQLERILQQQGFGTRKACRARIRHGTVSVRGVPCTDPFADIDTTDLVFAVDGVEWPYFTQATVILHKPAGYECSRRPQHHPSVLQLLPDPLRERDVQPVGRLDVETTGLLLLTDDGQLNHRLTSPRHKVPKVYIAECAEPVGAAQVDALLAGVSLHDEPAPIAALACTVTAPNILCLTLAEGKYHQVRRMIAATGNAVVNLHRERIGDLVLPADLAPGQWRWAWPADLLALGVSA